MIPDVGLSETTAQPARYRLRSSHPNTLRDTRNLFDVSHTAVRALVTSALQMLHRWCDSMQCKFSLQSRFNALVGSKTILKLDLAGWTVVVESTAQFSPASGLVQPGAR